jgi:enolase
MSRLAVCSRTRLNWMKRWWRSNGSPTKSRLGANATLAVSVAFARVNAEQQGVPLYQHFADMLGAQEEAIPRLTINLFSGGKRAGQQISIQDVMIIPMSARTVDEALVSASDIYQAAADLAFREYGAHPLTADEGEPAPPFRTATEMFYLAVESIHHARYRLGEDVCLGVDVASTHLHIQTLRAQGAGKHAACSPGKCHASSSPLGGAARASQLFCQHRLVQRKL